VSRVECNSRNSGAKAIPHTGRERKKDKEEDKWDKE